jgi:Ca-activated chloride channel family protein
MARAGRGAEVLANAREDVERATKRLIDRTRAPVLTNLEISGGALVEAAPEHVPDVFEGAPVVAAVRLSPEGGELVVRGELAGAKAEGDPYRSAARAWIQKISVPPKRDGEGNQAIVALFAREHVADLEMRWTIGKDTAAIDRAIEATGVRYQISTRLTSWVAIDEARRVDPLVPARHEVVPQNVPYGTSAESFGLRASMMALPMQLQAGAAAPMAMGVPMMRPSMRGAPMAPMGPMAPMAPPAARAPRVRQQDDFFDEESTARAVDPGAYADMSSEEELGAPASAPRAAPPTVMMAGSDAPPYPAQAMLPPAIKQLAQQERSFDPVAGAPMLHAATSIGAARSRSRAWLVLLLLFALIAGFLVWWLVL